MQIARIAHKQASKSDHNFRHGAVVMRGGKILATGYNHHGLHAEVVALQKLWPSERRGTKVISVRVGKSGRLTMGKPCPKCEAYMREYGVHTVVYSDNDSKLCTMRLK